MPPEVAISGPSRDHHPSRRSNLSHWRSCSPWWDQPRGSSMIRLTKRVIILFLLTFKNPSIKIWHAPCFAFRLQLTLEVHTLHIYNFSKMFMIKNDSSTINCTWSIKLKQQLMSCIWRIPLSFEQEEEALVFSCSMKENRQVLFRSIQYIKTHVYIIQIITNPNSAKTLNTNYLLN